MSTFSSLLNSLQNGKSQDTASTPSDTAQKSQYAAPRPASIPPTAGVKRKADARAIAPSTKVARLTPPSQNAPRPQPMAKLPAVQTKPQAAPAQPYRGTIGSGTTSAAQKVVKPAMPAKQPQGQAAAAPTVAKKGFAALMAKASAAQESMKATGVNTIKHKPTEMVKKKDRARMVEESKAQAISRKPGQSNGAGRSSGVNIVKTAKPPRPELSYTGTMQSKSAAAPAQKSFKKKSMGQDKYGGYASWDDLDDAEDDEEQYDEDESDMEEAGFDDMMDEEEQASRIARQEDKRELEQEERLKREKLERKKKLMALSSSAAAAKKRF